MVASGLASRGAAVAPHEDSRSANDFVRDELAWARAKLDRMPAHEPAVVELPDDWHTQGDWIGAYGQQFGVLCAAQSPHSIHVGHLNPRVRYDPMLGAHRKYFVREPDPKRHTYRYVSPDALRYWIWDNFADGGRPLVPTITMTPVRETAEQLAADTNGRWQMLNRFLADKENASLQAALLADRKLFDALYNIPELDGSSSLAQECLNSKEDPDAFKQHFMAFCLSA
jgi:hypothetical protein